MLGCGLLTIGLMSWSYRLEPNPFAVLMRRLACAATGGKAVLLVEHREHIGRGYECGEPDAPAIAMGCTVKHGITHELRDRYAYRRRSQ